MKKSISKIIDQLYKTYSFIEEDKDKFSKIVLGSISSDLSEEEAIQKAKENIVIYAVAKIKARGFTKLFEKSVNKIGIGKSFEMYDMILQETNLDLDLEDINKLAANEKYVEYCKTSKSEDNFLIESILEASTSEEDMDIDLEKFNSEVSDNQVDDYFAMIRDIPVLEREQEQELIRKYRETHDKEYKDEFITHNLKLAAKEASLVYKKYRDTLNLSLMDLIQEGNMGLLIAFDHFDETKGNKFSTYATWWVKQRIRRSIYNENDTVRIPVHQYEKITKMNSFIVGYRNKYGDVPTEEEIMKYMNLGATSYKLLKKADNIRSTVSLDLTISNEDTTASREKTFSNFIADENTSDVEEKAVSKFSGEQLLVFAKGVLTEREYDVVLNRMGYNKNGETKTLEELGKKYGVTRERVRQIEERAIEKLRKKSRQLIAERDNTAILSKKDLYRKLRAKGIYSVDILQYRKGYKAVFECVECNNKFTEDPFVLIDRGSCPFCEEKAKQLIKQKEE